MVSCRGTRGDSREGDKRDKGYKRANGPKVSSRKGFAKFIYEFSHLDPVK